MLQVILRKKFPRTCYRGEIVRKRNKYVEITTKGMELRVQAK